MSEAVDAAPTYTPRPVLKYTSNVVLLSGTVGVVLSAVQNALDKHNRGAMGVLTRTGGTIGFFAAMGGTFAFTEAYVANLREKNDALNGAAGGCAAGFLAGVRSRSIPMALAGCALLGGTIGGYDYTGQLMGDQTETREERRKRFFKTPPPPIIGSPSSD